MNNTATIIITGMTAIPALLIGCPMACDAVAGLRALRRRARTL